MWKVGLVDHKLGTVVEGLLVYPVEMLVVVLVEVVVVMGQK